MPFEPGEVFGPAPADDLLAFLAEEGQVRQASDGRWYWSSENFPASEISLRTAAPENVVIIDTTPDRPRVLGEVDLFSAQVLVHERAIYIHESIQYYVDRLEWHERKAYVHKIDVDHYTYADRAVTLKPLEKFAEAEATGGRRIHGEVMVASLVTMFKKLKFLTDENVGWGPIDLPELELQTTAYWLTAERLATPWRRDDLDVALLGAGRAIQTVASVLLMVDPRDLGGAVRQFDGVADFGADQARRERRHPGDFPGPRVGFVLADDPEFDPAAVLALERHPRAEARLSAGRRRRHDLRGALALAPVAKVPLDAADRRAILRGARGRELCAQALDRLLDPGLALRRHEVPVRADLKLRERLAVVGVALLDECPAHADMLHPMRPN